MIDLFDEPIVVTQDHTMGCGVACVASVLNISYDNALQLFKNKENAWTKGYMCIDLIYALKKGGKIYSYKQLKILNDPILKKTGTIVFTDYCEAYPAGHYLVRMENGWINPWVNFPEINPARSGIVEKLPARPIYVIFSKLSGTQ